jgi:2-dehydropantoate 2-reductase
MSVVRRYVVLGAGAIGCALGGLLRARGFAVHAIARGAQLEALAAGPLGLALPSRILRVPLPVVDAPAALTWSRDDVVLLCTKSQDSQAALDALLDAGARDTAVVCAQNGVANERLAAERFERAYGAMVFAPVTYTEAGRVNVHSETPYGVIEIGRVPSGSDDLARAIASDLSAAGFEARAHGSVMRAKHTKLLSNLANAVQALAGSAALRSAVVDEVMAEGAACYRAAGVDYEPMAVLEQRCAAVRDLAVPADDNADAVRIPRDGGSTWQSLARGTGTVETAYLNGEIIRLGAAFGVRTPLNAALVALAERAAADRWPPGRLGVEELEAALRKSSAR